MIIIEIIGNGFLYYIITVNTCSTVWNKKAQKQIKTGAILLNKILFFDIDSKYASDDLKVSYWIRQPRSKINK